VSINTQERISVERRSFYFCFTCSTTILFLKYNRIHLAVTVSAHAPKHPPNIVQWLRSDRQSLAKAVFTIGTVSDAVSPNLTLNSIAMRCSTKRCIFNTDTSPKRLSRKCLCQLSGGSEETDLQRLCSLKPQPLFPRRRCAVECTVASETNHWHYFPDIPCILVYAFRFTLFVSISILYSLVVRRSTECRRIEKPWQLWRSPISVPLTRPKASEGT